MKISYTYDTDTKQTQILVAEAAWSVTDADENGESKFLAFGTQDDTLNVIVPMGPKAVHDMGTTLLKPTIVKASVSDIDAVRKGHRNGSS